jgi:hypothetical protein
MWCACKRQVVRVLNRKQSVSSEPPFFGIFQTKLRPRAEIFIVSHEKARGRSGKFNIHWGVIHTPSRHKNEGFIRPKRPDTAYGVGILNSDPFAPQFPMHSHCGSRCIQDALSDERTRVSLRPLSGTAFGCIAEPSDPGTR